MLNTDIYIYDRYPQNSLTLLLLFFLVFAVSIEIKICLIFVSDHGIWL